MFQRILITGAAGRLGSVLRKGLCGKYPSMRLSDIVDLGPAQPGEELVRADLRSFEEVNQMMEGVDAVVHLGAQLGSNLDKWQDVIQTNIIGTSNIFEAARCNGTKRVIFASSHHAVGFYRRHQVIGLDVQPRPDSHYGASKIYGEALGRMYADKFGLSVICQRIGVSRATPQDVRSLSAWLSFGDYLHLTQCCLEAPDIHFLIVYGVSANTRQQWHNPAAKVIGYTPVDNAEDYLDEILAKQKFEQEPEIERLFYGGWYCSDKFDGDPNKID